MRTTMKNERIQVRYALRLELYNMINISCRRPVGCCGSRLH